MTTLKEIDSSKLKYIVRAESAAHLDARTRLQVVKVLGHLISSVLWSTCAVSLHADAALATCGLQIL